MKKIIIITCLTVLPSVTFAAAHSKIVKVKTVDKQSKFDLSAKTVDKQSKFGLSAKVGTLGAGLDLTFKIKPKLNVRLNVNGATANYDKTDNGVAYKGDLKLFTLGALVDYHPFGNGFRATGGLYSNNNKIEGSATGSTDNATIGDIEYDISNATISSKVGFKSTAPYLGIGWGNAVRGYKNFNFSIDAGVLFQGRPDVKLTSSGTVTDVTNNIPDISTSEEVFQSELRKEENNLNNDLKDFEYFPVVSVGFSYNF